MPLPYQSYLRSDGWKEKRWTVIMLWECHCARCGRVFHPNALEVHHTRYDVDLRTVPIEELKPMCKKCHAAIYPSTPVIVSAATAHIQGSCLVVESSTAGSAREPFYRKRRQRILNA